MKVKKLFGLITVLIILLSLTTTAFAIHSYEENISPPADNVSQIIGDGNTVVFVDVPTGHWAKDQIEYFAQQGIVDGYTDGSFKPEAGVTRAEFCKLLVSTFKQPLQTPNTPTFADVPENHWSYPYVEVCREFLTGYANPFGGLPSFHPSEYATREDIAVALVRMMGFTDSDASDPGYAAWKFTDGGNISPSIVGYVSLACERGLISGYPDGSFGPSKGITRAETVVLLNRATKQAVTDINAELEMTANLLYSEDGKTATINIVAEEGTTVTVNGESVKMSSNYNGEYEGNYVYKFEQEGSKDFTIEGKRAGKTKIINATAKYEIGAPVLTVTQCPTTTSTKTIQISGTAKDAANGFAVSINGESVDSRVYPGTMSWYKNFTLNEGENTFTITATNTEGKTSTVTKVVTFNVGGPTLTITQCPTVSTNKTIQISGTASDSNYGVSVSINGESVDSRNSSGTLSWYKYFTLKEGENTFIITATSTAGKTVTETKTVTFNVGGPTLTITQCPTVSTNKTIQISGTASDDNYGVSVSINGETVDSRNSSGTLSWYKYVTLQEGENTFTITATSTAGKTVTESKMVTFNVGGPTLIITECPTTVTSPRITISGTASDSNYGVSVDINGETINSRNSSGTLSWYQYVTLKEGENTFIITATSTLGKTTSETKVVTFKVSAPEIQFINCPESTKKNSITIKGKITGDNEGAMLFIDDEEVYVNYSGEFSETVDLKEGDNTFEFRAVNDYGKEVSVTKTITYTPEVEEDTSEETEE